MKSIPKCGVHTYCLILAILFLLSGTLFAQTFISTNHTNNNSSGLVTFNVQNTNSYAIIITDLSSHFGTNIANNIQVLYRATPINEPGTWTLGVVEPGQNGWISAGATTLSTSGGIYHAFSNLSIIIPANTTYTIAVSATVLNYMNLTAGAGINTFSSGGVNLLTGDGISWGGSAVPSTPVNYPRGFIGSIGFVPAMPCSGMPQAGTITGNSNACGGQNITLQVNNGSIGLGIDYQW